MSISSVSSSPAPIAKPMVSAPVNDHDADDLPAAAATLAPPAPGTGKVLDKIA